MGGFHPNLLPILPFGEPVLYLRASEFRKTVVSHDRKGMYVGPDLRKHGSIIAGNPATLSVAESITAYSILSTVPKEWLKPDPHSFPEPLLMSHTMSSSTTRLTLGIRVWSLHLSRLQQILCLYQRVSQFQRMQRCDRVRGCVRLRGCYKD